MVQAKYFDGRSDPHPRRDLSLAGAELVIAGEDINLQFPFARRVSG